MKEHAKNALKHDTKVLGKTVPTMIIIGLFLVGGGSAALLSSFGKVSGDADVQQAVTIDGVTASSRSGPTLEAEYNASNVVAGSFVSTDHELLNENSQPVEVSLTGSASASGVNPYRFLYSQKDNDGDGNYDVSVKASEPISGGSEYAVHFEADSTTDYAVVQYPVSQELTGSEEIKFDIAAEESNEAGSNGIDEVYLFSAEGTQLASITGKNADISGGTATISLDSADYWAGAPSDFAEVEVIGIGYGDASAAFEGVDGTETTVNVTVDDVKVARQSVDEQTTGNVYLKPTGEFNGDVNGQAVDTNVKYGLHSVVAFSPYLVPDEYSASTSVDTITS